MKKTLVILLLLSPPALARDYTIRIDDKALAIVGNALAQRPYAEVAPLIQSLQQQINEQEKAVQQVPETKKGDK